MLSEIVPRWSKSEKLCWFLSFFLLLACASLLSIEPKVFKDIIEVQCGYIIPAKHTQKQSPRKDIDSAE